MTDSARRLAIDDLYSYRGLPRDGAQVFEHSLGPRSEDILLDAVGAAGAGPNTIVVDAGCRESSWPIKLSQRFNCRVLGLDLVRTWLPDAAQEIDAAGLDERIGLMQGDIERLPIKDESVDVVFCRDTLSCIGDAEQALREFARVLRPGGGAVLYVVFATERLLGYERELLFESETIGQRSMEQDGVEAAIAAAGLTVAGRDVLGSELTEWRLEDDPAILTDSFLEAARLIRKQEQLRRSLGPTWYRHCLRFALWGPWILLGKLDPALYTLAKPTR